MSDRDIEKDYRAIITTAKQIQRERKAAERKRAEYLLIIIAIFMIGVLLLVGIGIWAVLL